MPFSQLGLGPKINAAVREAGYETPTPIQEKAIPAILTGSDVVGIAQTGTGKTAAFTLPMIQTLAGKGRHKAPRALVVTPTRELAVQIHENVTQYGRHLGLRFATIYGGVGEKPQIDALRRGVDLMIATPGRLLDLMQQGHVDTKSIEYVVLDEADRMLDIGFLPAIRRIMKELPAKRQTLLFSATFSVAIERIAAEFLTSPVKFEVGPTSKPIDTIEQAIHEVPRGQKVDLLIHLLKEPSMDLVLVFARTRRGADKIHRSLKAAGIPCETIHSSRSQSQRQRALDLFKKGGIRVLVATDVASRGIDVDGISHVVNFDFPEQTDDYIHRIGRTGRAHATGDAISFVSPEDYLNLFRLEKRLGRRLPRIEVAGFAIERREIKPVIPIRSAPAGATVATQPSFRRKRRSRC